MAGMWQRLGNWLIHAREYPFAARCRTFPHRCHISTQGAAYLLEVARGTSRTPRWSEPDLNASQEDQRDDSSMDPGTGIGAGAGCGRGNVCRGQGIEDRFQRDVERGLELDPRFESGW